MASRVTVVQRILPHYRVPFFIGLRDHLESVGIELTLIYGQARRNTVPQTVDLAYPWTHKIQNHYILPLGKELVWQPAYQYAKNTDLVIVEQASRLVLNYLLSAKRRYAPWKLAYWGHGQNLQSRSRRSLAEYLKRMFALQADHCFAYTQLSRDLMVAQGIPEDRITVVDNTLDTASFAGALAACREEDLEKTRKALGLESGPTALYCGGMYQEKRLDFLLESCRKIRERVADFQMIFVGNGPDQDRVQRFADQNPWTHYVGARFGEERAVFFCLSQALLMPGPVGLAIVDSFVARTPLFTTNIPIHGPEIAYLEQGVNGMICPNTLASYADNVAEYLTSDHLQKTLKAGCRRSAEIYTLDNMIQNFAGGIKVALGIRGGGA